MESKHRISPSLTPPALVQPEEGPRAQVILIENPLSAYPPSRSKEELLQILAARESELGEIKKDLESMLYGRLDTRVDLNKMPPQENKGKFAKLKDWATSTWAAPGFQGSAGKGTAVVGCLVIALGLGILALSLSHVKISFLAQWQDQLTPSNAAMLAFYGGCIVLAGIDRLMKAKTLRDQEALVKQKHTLKDEIAQAEKELQEIKNKESFIKKQVEQIQDLIIGAEKNYVRTLNIETSEATRIAQTQLHAQQWLLLLKQEKQSLPASDQKEIDAYIDQLAKLATAECWTEQSQPNPNAPVLQPPLVSASDKPLLADSLSPASLIITLNERLKEIEKEHATQLRQNQEALKPSRTLLKKLKPEATASKVLGNFFLVFGLGILAFSALQFVDFLKGDQILQFIGAKIPNTLVPIIATVMYGAYIMFVGLDFRDKAKIKQHEKELQKLGLTKLSLVSEAGKIRLQVDKRETYLQNARASHVMREKEVSEKNQLIAEKVQKYDFSLQNWNHTFQEIFPRIREILPLIEIPQLKIA